MLKSEAAAYLAGLSSEENTNAASATNVHTISGEVLEDSANGVAKVAIDGMVISEEDDQYISVDTVGGLKAGDVVTMLISGEDGHGMTPLAIGAVGSVDRLETTVQQIDAYAQAAQTSALAAADSAQEAADNAEASALSALEAQNNAQTSAEAAQQAQSNAQTSAEAAQLAQSNASASAQAAQLAQQNAENAAQSASDSAQSAHDSEAYAEGALRNLSIVEDVVDILEWLSTHSKPTTDTTVVTGKNYYIRDPQTGVISHVDNPEDYSNPSQEGWVELDEAVANYIGSHLVLTDYGLNLMVDGTSGYIHLGTLDGNHAYGTYILDSDGREIGKFAQDGAIIGKPYSSVDDDNESHVAIDYHSLQLVDKDNNPYFYVSDLRDSSGKAIIVDTFVGDGSTTRFTLTHTAASNIYNVKVSDDSGTSVNKGLRNFTFATAPTVNSVITATYKTKDARSKAYTFGSRGDGNVGAMSVVSGGDCVAAKNYDHAEGWEATASGGYSHAEGCHTTASGYGSHSEGYYTTASGTYSHAEGDHTTASGVWSHAEGDHTTANGFYSHAEGGNTTASGVWSHAQNLNTIAASKNQTAMGRYNIEDGDTSIFTGDGITQSFTLSGTPGTCQVFIENQELRLTHLINGVMYGDLMIDGNLYRYTYSTNGAVLTISPAPEDGMSVRVVYSYDKYALIIGNGSSDSARSNALTVDWNGTVDIGPTTVTAEDSGLKVHGSNLSTASQTASANLYALIAGMFDKGGNLRSYLKHVDFTSGYQGVQVETHRVVNGSHVYNGVVMSIAANGTRAVSLSDATAWRNALGIGHYTAPTTLPLNSACTAYSSAMTPKYMKEGRVVTLTGAVKPAKAVDAGDTMAIGTLPAGFRPQVEIQVLCQGSSTSVWLLTVNTSGAVAASRYRAGGESSYHSMSTSIWLPFHVTFIASTV